METEQIYNGEQQSASSSNKFSSYFWIGLMALIVIMVVCSYTFGYFMGQSSIETTVEVPQETEPAVETTEFVTEPTEPETVEPTTEAPTEPVTEEPTHTEPPTEPVTEAPSEPSGELVMGEPGTASTWSDVELLACVIFQEAGADYVCDECRVRVADVVLNRVADDRYPDTIYEVLTQKQQYGRFYWTDVVWADRAYYDCNKHAVERSFKIAEEVLNGRHSDLYGAGYIGQAEFIPGRDWIYCCGIYYGR